MVACCRAADWVQSMFLHYSSSQVRSIPASPLAERACRRWWMAIFKTGRCHCPCWPTAPPSKKVLYTFDVQLYVTLCPAFLADTQFQPVCAITYPVNLASQGDFWAQTFHGGLLNSLSSANEPDLFLVGDSKWIAWTIFLCPLIWHFLNAFCQKNLQKIFRFYMS